MITFFIICFIFSKDINECITDDNDCTDKCINNIGSYTCDCPSGETLDSDGLTCVGRLMLSCDYGPS